ncbi:MAG: exonuclease SbcCD subunit D [Candidatus Latescibacteria bacterium]|nr:exonuclease SbcCD subunit D [Candidatus Latescibacterota bacterium]
MTLKFLHFADVHLGVENHGRFDPFTGLHTRVQDFIRCLRFAVEEAIKEKVDLAVFAGDAYRTCDPTPTHQREFAAQIKALSDEGIPVVMVTGNHDHPVSFGRASSIDIFSTLDTPEVHILARPRLLRVKTKAGPVQIAGLPWPSRSQLLTRNEYKDLFDDEVAQKIQEICAGIIQDFADQIDPRHPALLVAHVAAADALYSGSERTSVIGRDPIFLTSVLANSAFDYVALGHVHRFQDLNPSGGPPVVYCGSLDRVNFGEEKESKGFCIVTVRDADGAGEERQGLPLFSLEGPQPPQTHRRETAYRFVRTPARPFLTVEVEIPPETDPTQALLDAIARHDLEDAVVRVIYDLSDDRPDVVDLKTVRTALDPAFFVASVTRKPREAERLRRASVSEETGLQDALARYIENNPDLSRLKPDLLSCAARLEQELQESEKG